MNTYTFYISTWTTFIIAVVFVL